MNSKYKPGIYFGIFVTVVNIIIMWFMHPEAFTATNFKILLISTLVGGLIGGLVFGLTWNWIKNRQTRD